MNIASAQPITPQNALKYSMWLAVAHPEAFQAVLNTLVPQTQRRQRVALGGAPGMGAVGPTSRIPRSGTFIPKGSRPAPGPAFARGRFGTLRVGGAPSMGNFGDDLPEITITAPSQLEEFTPTVQMMPVWQDPVLQDINVDIPPSSFDLGTAASSIDNSGGFWSSLGSGLSSIGGGIVNAVGTVARAVTNPAVLNAAGTIAATVIKANASNQQSSQQLALLQQQQQRTLTGAGANPVRYATDPATGQTVPMYYNPSTGQYQLQQPGFFSSLSSGTGLTQYLPYILIGGGVILVAVLMRSPR